MKTFLLINIFLAPIFLFGQSISYDTSKTFDKHLNWTGIHYKNPIGQQSYDVWTFYYDNGQRKLVEVTDTNFTYHKKVNAWLANGTQLMKNGNGFYIELNGKDSLVFTVRDSMYEGICKSFTHFPRNKSWKLHATGNYSKGVRTGEWLFCDSIGAPTASCTYVNDQVKGKCSIYYPKIGIVSASGNLENCRKIGLWKSYDSTGILLVECNYENGEKKGEFTSYYPNGKIKSKGQYNQTIKKLKVARENPANPGTFISHSKERIDFVPIKTGIWFFYNENGDLIDSKKYSNEMEVPENWESYKTKHQTYYYRSLPVFKSVPDCNYY